MAFPAGLTLVTVHGRFDTLPNGSATGTVEFTCRNTLVGSGDDSIVPPFSRSAVLDDDGEFTLDLPATNDPGWAPQGWAYAVRITAAGTSVRGSVQLDYQNTAVELADLLQVDGTVTPGVSYILAGQRSIAGGVAGLDGDGDVIDAAGNKVTGGGGGGSGTPSSTVVSGTSFGASSTAGVATAYSRGDHSHGTPAAQTLASLGAAATVHTHTASQISDSTTVGRAVVTATDAAAARTAIGAGTSSLAIGTSGTTAAAGNDSRLSDSRTPTAHASSHASAGSDPVALDTSQITTGTLAIARIPTGSSSSTVAIGNDSRLSDSRTPTAHASTHNAGGSDAMAIDAVAATGSLRTLGAGSTQAAAGNHTHSGTYQPLDSDLTTIAGLTATTGNFMVAAGSAWSSVTPSAAKTALSLAASDVGLGSVTNDAQVKLSTVTTKGDLLAGTGSAAVARVAAGTNGYALVADSTQTAGLKYVPSAPMIVLGPSDPIPGGTPTGTVVVRTAT